MSRTFELNCWVLGDDTDRIFSVKIAETESVSTLKDVIKGKKPVAFQHVDADAIKLWKVNVLADDSLQEAVRDLRLDRVHCQQLLLPVKRLSGLYREALPADDRVHIVIQRPPNVPSPQPQPTDRILELNCWVLGNDVNSVFTIEIQGLKNVSARIFSAKIAETESVSTLKDVIKGKKLVAFQHVDADALDLWKISTSIAVDRNLEQQVLDLDVENLEPLYPVTKLSEVFPDSLVDKNLHVVIRAASPASIAQDSVDVLTLRRVYLSKKPPRASSTLGQPSEFRKEQDQGDRAIYCNRPSKAADPIPVTLLHPVFGQFIDDTQNLEPSAEDNELVRKLKDVMSTFHDVEGARAVQIRETLKEAKIDLKQTVIEGTGFTTDGDSQYKDYRYIIAEMKNEIGSKGAEPYAQAALYYLESTRKQALDHPESVIPTIIVLFFGPYMAFAGAVWTTRPNVQILSTAVPFHYHSSDDISQTCAARHIAALKNAVESLQQHYNNGLPASTEASKAKIPRKIFPYPTTFQSLREETEVEMQYLTDDGRKTSVRLPA